MIKKIPVAQLRIGSRIPDDVQADPVISVPQPIAHPTDVAPGLVRHPLGCTLTQPARTLAHPFQAAFHGIAQQAVAGQGGTIHASPILLDPLGVLDNIGQAVGRIVPRRHADGLDQCSPAGVASR